jgi:hypothetical protein
MLFKLFIMFLPIEYKFAIPTTNIYRECKERKKHMTRKAKINLDNTLSSPIRSRHNFICYIRHNAKNMHKNYSAKKCCTFFTMIK